MNTTVTVQEYVFSFMKKGLIPEYLYLTQSQYEEVQYSAALIWCLDNNVPVYVDFEQINPEVEDLNVGY